MTFLSSQSYPQRLWNQTNLYKQSTGLVAGLSPPIAGFDPKAVHVGFSVYRLILGNWIRIALKLLVKVGVVSVGFEVFKAVKSGIVVHWVEIGWNGCCHIPIMSSFTKHIT